LNGLPERNRSTFSIAASRPSRLTSGVWPALWGQHLHAEALRMLRDARADGAGAEYRERLAVELREHVARPSAVPHLAVDSRDPARHGEHQRDRGRPSPRRPRGNRPAH
jgi:hypothetical protein